MTYTGTVSGEGDAITIDFGEAPVTLTADGQLTITRGAEVGDKQDDTYQVSVTVTDADNDVTDAVSATLTTSTPEITDTNPDTPAIEADTLTVKEEALSHGTNPESEEEGVTGHSFTVDMKGEDGTITFGDVTITVSGDEAMPSATTFTTGLGSTVSNITATVEDGVEPPPQSMCCSCLS